MKLRWEAHICLLMLGNLLQAQFHASFLPRFLLFQNLHHDFS